MTAAVNLPDLCLLCEYVGEVYTDEVLETRPHNDSIMELLCTGDPKTSLNVAPERYSNVARFFNGINNSVAGSKRKQQNIRTMRCQVDGQATVLLYTSKAVRKGEQLRFDYNEGLKNLYPTDHFL